MKRFRKILVFIDALARTDPVLTRAASLARATGASLEIVDVLQQLPKTAPLIPARGKSLGTMVVEELRERVDKHAARLTRRGISVQTGVLTGSPAEEITREVLQERHDLVMMTARAAGTPGPPIFGTVAVRLMRMCPCPVWVIHPRQKTRFKRILAAVDPDPNDPAQIALSNRVIELATVLAREERSQLHVVYARSGYAETLVKKVMSPDTFRDYVRDARSEARQRIDALLEPYLDAIEGVHVLDGEPEEIIPKVASRRRVELIVMGTVARAGLEGFFIGNTAETILGRIRCSVLTLKPEGFVSPVSLPD